MYALGIDLGTTFTAAAIWRDGQAEIASLGSRGGGDPVGRAAARGRDRPHRRGAPTGGPDRAAPGRPRVQAAPRRHHADPARRRAVLGRGADGPAAALGRRRGRRRARAAPPTRSASPTRRTGDRTRPICCCRRSAWPTSTSRSRSPPSRRPRRSSTPSSSASTPGAMVAVYDLGGGTFDAAVLRKTADRLRAPRPARRASSASAASTSTRPCSATWPRRSAASWPSWTRTIRRRSPRSPGCARSASQAKEALSADTDVSIPVLLPNLSHRGTADPRRAGGDGPARRCTTRSRRCERALRSAEVPPSSCTRSCWSAARPGCRSWPSWSAPSSAARSPSTPTPSTRSRSARPGSPAARCRTRARPAPSSVPPARRSVRSRSVRRPLVRSRSGRGRSGRRRCRCRRCPVLRYRGRRRRVPRHRWRRVQVGRGGRSGRAGRGTGGPQRPGGHRFRTDPVRQPVVPDPGAADRPADEGQALLDRQPVGADRRRRRPDRAAHRGRRRDRPDHRQWWVESGRRPAQHHPVGHYRAVAERPRRTGLRPVHRCDQEQPPLGLRDQGDADRQGGPHRVHVRQQRDPVQHEQWLPRALLRGERGRHRPVGQDRRRAERRQLVRGGQSSPRCTRAGPASTTPSRGTPWSAPGSPTAVTAWWPTTPARESRPTGNCFTITTS